MKDDVYDACAWGSHLPPLLGCIGDTVGHVLEIGVGNFSTPALHAICGSSQRKLVSLEQSKEWIDKFRGRFSKQNHIFHLGEYDETVPFWARDEWSVALIDNSPGGERRRKDFETMIQRSIYVVVHDYHLENSQAIEPLLKGLAYHVCNLYQPQTLVASKFREIPNCIKVL